MSKKRLLIGVSEWGYGPIATLKPILDQFKETYEIIVYVRSLHVIDFINTNCKYINIFIKSYKELMLLKNVDMVLSCMNIGVLLFAKKYNICSYCIDNLYYFWNWKREDFDSYNMVVNDKKINDIEIYKKIKLLPNYAAYIGMYSIPRNIFIQKYCNNYILGSIYKNKIIEVSPIIKKIDVNKIDIDKRKGILISFSGLITPYSNNKNISLYMNFVKKILYNVLEFYNKNVLITVPKEALAIAKNIFSMFNINITSLNQSEFFLEMSKRRLLFVPCGFSTTYEAMYYKIPLIFLPEFHDGNLSNYLGMGDFVDYNVDKIKKLFPCLCLKIFLSDSKYTSVDELYKEYYINIRNELLINRYRQYINIITKIFYENYMEKFLLQKNFLLEKMNNLDGENKIITIIQRRVANV